MQIFAAAFAPGDALGADAAALRNTLGAIISPLLRNLPWGSDAAMYSIAAARLGNASLAASILADLTSGAPCSRGGQHLNAWLLLAVVALGRWGWRS